MGEKKIERDRRGREEMRGRDIPTGDSLIGMIGKSLDKARPVMGVKKYI